MNVHARSVDNLKVEIVSGSHTYFADEPVADGGGDAGPDPYSFLLGALAACKIMTVELYARRKGWPLEEVDIILDHRKIHARDCEECSAEGEALVDFIKCEISFKGALDAEQRLRLKEISERCPVHRTLVSEVAIRTSLKGREEEAP
jgi:putative redox protein